MSIYIKEESTVVVCNVCGYEEKTEKANGVVPVEWTTGQLWIDISLADQRQVPLCFCPDCGPRVLTELKMGF